MNSTGVYYYKKNVYIKDSKGQKTREVTWAFESRVPLIGNRQIPSK